MLEESTSVLSEAHKSFHNIRLSTPRSHVPQSSWGRWSKRVLDLAMVAATSWFVVPLVAVLALAVWATSPGGAFYAQERIGRGGRRFRAWKFRTMVLDADAVLEEHLARDPALRAEWQANHKLRHDPRVTTIGRFLRQTSFDEVPQLWNVVRGEMSLVGPRPIVAAEVPRYQEQFDLYQQVLPGITGLWQISGRSTTTYAQRVELDASYVRGWSLWLDLYILFCTAWVVLRREGAY